MPVRVRAFHQRDLPCARPSLQRLLSLDRIQRRRMLFEIDKPLDAISPCKALDLTIAMFRDALDQMAGHSDVERAPRLAAKEVGPVAHLGPCIGSMDPGSR